MINRCDHSYSDERRQKKMY